MRTLYIPTIGDVLTLAEDWTFTLHAESRNMDLHHLLSDPPRHSNGAIDYHNYVREPIPVTLPAGSVLKMDRIYIRKGVSDYGSVTFWLTDCPNKAWAPKKVGGTAVGRLRFWVKLHDANTMVIL